MHTPHSRRIKINRCSGPPKTARLKTSSCFCACFSLGSLIFPITVPSVFHLKSIIPTNQLSPLRSLNETTDLVLLWGDHTSSSVALCGLIFDKHPLRPSCLVEDEMQARSTSHIHRPN
jgi:hypothetical protein